MTRNKKKPLNWLDKTLFVLMLLVIVGMIVALSVADGAKLYILLGGGGLLVLNLLFVLYFARRNRL
ncbi:hypothetical protein [Porphyromonas asaccharolytica]|uniref:Uncharacterized protein n=1 Tax=Porphyromonas asaccharolytica (strain ATCC 25260 / DSM 20707 / BCRC 10618 / CCUG 7834 / JCM 6326 / LMG 13178 / VPI 4198 / B440) TaxID=879243 RepID=F4KKC1_PORAD|nr:hypothetical protein [Porphyromonas asaccharolytica]AEE12846.1 hypothetical protein Poras_0903 [Porphyromonas asaccharolytica DSM 20707]EFR34569.1 hypothetical protein HMPREF9294_0166 [Porphyromonas asaccharolytica PR426713P-I]